MKITSAELVISAAAPKQFPPTKVPEVAFVGRSNVGKSTLINSLLNRKSLVKTSSTPGKTQLINFFRINQSFHCVDLPGYGFAKVPEPIRRSWRALIEAYLAGREPLRGVVLIIDSRQGPTAEDVQFKQWLDESQRPVLVVANKVDKLKRNDLAKQNRIIQQKLGLEQPPLAHSSLKKIGRRQIWGALRPWLS
ncbi:MAG TPA: YihA family ribosome biogenesis GTP-binding protein [Deltaproteobacteria bacterium]|jgi:GTP-binding protein|nr:ribosome biogenesis GTP-binding protein YihA/YsxC [SAR324 cluster bacterium]HBI28472.1 YihA family ribosome biogenesis GTP-binding protein [Deltaproteobacteria bacterium]HIF69912.1 YihA family ribosome biogenesis GTP-binding protein [Candidatus Lambdaproteobacteria bacterium]HIL16013.1 YihA family ribosome biogenesis GTP-binding protein [Deltaproteobacteria bacterium]|tara:strand:- start:238 stop:816 length:579 start_codon:yes stop_codon:yes gene_type:complete